MPTPHLLTRLSLWAVFLTLIACESNAEEFAVTPETKLRDVVKKVKQGDAIVLASGTWTDAELKFERLPGTAEQPITIRAETPGDVVITGKSSFRVSGKYITVSGLIFRDSTGVGDVFEFRTHSERHAHFCRITDCVFQESKAFVAGGESRWLSVYGTNNRVDHCYLAGKKNPGTTLVVWLPTKAGDDQPHNHQIDHNHFGPRPPLGKNGGETIRIGTSEVSEQVSGTRVFRNYFHECDGESEVISNKSCENIYQYNFFDKVSGALTLRHGHRCLVDGNAFIGRKARGTGGVRIIGKSHIVTNNYFEQLRGDAERAALSMMNGIPDSPLNAYAPVEDAVVAHNTFVDCKVMLEIGVGAGKRQTAAPTGCRMAHNVFIAPRDESFRLHVEPDKFQWIDNRQQSDSRRDEQPIDIELVDLKFARAKDGLMRPSAESPIESKAVSDVKLDIDGQPRQRVAVTGCDQPNTPLQIWPAPSNTGPSWLRTERRH